MAAMLVSTNSTMAVPLCTTTTTVSSAALALSTLSKATTISSIPVRAIPVPNSNKLILAGPCIVLRAATVAEQVQALRQDKKVTSKATEPQSPELLRCKRRSDISKLGFPEAKPASVSRRNARERNRVKLVNQGFETLREHVPNGKKNRKMSKVQTLRSAVEYIRQMQQLLEEHDAQLGKVKVNVKVDPCSGDEDSAADVNIESDDNDDVTSLVDSDIGMTSSVEMTDVDMAGTVSVSSTATTPVVDNNLNDNEIVPMECTSNNNNNNNKFVNFNINSSDGTNVSLHSVNNLNELNNANVNVNTLNMNTLGNTLLSPEVNTDGTVTAPQTYTILTVPVQHGMTQASDDVFLPDSSVSNGQALVSTGTNTLGTNSLGTMTTLRGMGSLSGGPGISFTEQLTLRVPEASVGHAVSIANSGIWNSKQQQQEQQQQQQPRQRLAALSESDSFVLDGQQTSQENGQQILEQSQEHLRQSQPQIQQGQHVEQQNQLQQQQHQLSQHQQQHQQNLHQQQHQQNLHQQQTMSASDHTLTDLSLADNTQALTILQRVMQNLDQQQQKQFLQHSLLPQSDCISGGNLLQPVSNLDVSLPDTTKLSQFQTLAMTQPQLSVDQVPSPSLSTASSHTSDSSYESYESLGSLEEELKDLSSWITEICRAGHVAGMQVNGETDETPDFLAYDDCDN